MTGKTLAQLILHLLILTQSAKAVPSEVYYYLSEQKVTLFEWGLYRLGESLNNAKLVNGTVSAFWHEEKIVISITPFWLPQKPSSPEAFCKDLIGKVKAHLSLGRTHGGRTFLSDFFSSTAVTRYDLPPKLGEKLERMTVIRVFDTQVFGDLTCESPLRGDSIEVKTNVNSKDAKKLD